MLLGREHEVTAIDERLARARARESSALVLRGDAGMGKTALFDHAAAAAADMRVLRAVGIESEAELPFAGLHVLLGPVVDRIDHLPDPQRNALRVALGMQTGQPGDRFLLGLAVLMLLSDAAGDGPLLCLVDDAQWMDRGSADVLLFAARRLDAEGVVLLFAARDFDGPGFPAPGIAEARLEPLPDETAARLLEDRAGDLPRETRDGIVAEAQGNVLALLEFTEAQRTGAAVTEPFRTRGVPQRSRVLRMFSEQVAALPQRTRDLLVTIAADTSGDPGVVLDAGAGLGCTAVDLEPAESGNLVVLAGGRLDFRHPMIRSAVYQEAPLQTRLRVHAELARVFGTQGNVCQRAWHLAASTTGPDDEVAAALENSAGIDGSLGGHSAAASALERAAELSREEPDRGRRLLMAAEAAVQGGHSERADGLAGRASALLTDGGSQARIAVVRARVAEQEARPVEVHGLLVDAARAVHAQVPDVAMDMLVWAAEAAWSDGSTHTVEDTWRLAGQLAPGRPEALAVLERFVTAVTRLGPGSVAEGVAAVRSLFGSGEWEPRDAATAVSGRLLLGEVREAHDLAVARERGLRDRGAIGALPLALSLHLGTALHLGRHAEARAAGTEGLQIVEDTQQSRGRSELCAGMARLAALEGDEPRCVELAGAVDTGSGGAAARARGALALLDLGAGRAESARDRLRAIVDGTVPLEGLMAVPDLVEASARLGHPKEAADALAWFEEWVDAVERPWARSLALRCRALLAESEPDRAGALYDQAVASHRDDAESPFERARTTLLQGEWTRRSRRPGAARSALRFAADTFEQLGARPWAERAATELRAAGESQAGGYRPAVGSGLTAQELAVVRLAATGMSNRAIGTQMFLSSRTVGYHLYKAFPKLGVSSRGELAALDLG
ncbi:helix-turn-helix transcriptional regulator [Pseudonocardia endophytica]|uniref:Regulatory LuxR family protein n=1 Tax=Pseudonocardia endophytica TaxID=401976 RepID=A0A4R1HP70_PSEEN|nr:helix-turn-helix transcriptional regulator [Pseudonocardia endophytica]TCK22445.1 regulatory LuxR family protein [Pseudonocardia endophytica]